MGQCFCSDPSHPFLSDLKRAKNLGEKTKVIYRLVDERIEMIKEGEHNNQMLSDYIRSYWLSIEALLIAEGYLRDRLVERARAYCHYRSDMYLNK